MLDLKPDMGVGLLVFLLLSLMQGVSCIDWDVELPERLDGITGSCITVPCGFTLPENEEKYIQNCTNGAIWYKGNLLRLQVFVGHKPFLNKIPGYLAGDLTQKNCTTVFQFIPKNYSDVYFFRVECEDAIQYSFKRGVIINTKEVPSPPQMSPIGLVLEGHLVTLQCSALVPCSALPPSFTWLPTDITWQRKTQLQQQPNGQMVMTSKVTFVASAIHHKRNISCYVSYPLTQGGSTKPAVTTQTLHVQYAPRSTAASISPSGPVPVGRAATLSCSSDANPPVSSYTWYRVHGEQLSKRAEEELLILQVGLNDSGLYVCEARSTMGSRRSSPVFLEVTTSGGVNNLVGPYIISGVLFILWILIVAVGVNKYRSLSRRLKHFEQQGEHIYANLRTRGNNADYDQIQRKASSGLTDYENMEEMKISKTNSGQRKTKGLS